MIGFYNVDMDEIEGLEGVSAYLKGQITPEVVVYGLSAAVGAVSAVIAVALARDLSRNW